MLSPKYFIAKYKKIVHSLFIITIDTLFYPLVAIDVQSGQSIFSFIFAPGEVYLQIISGIWYTFVLDPLRNELYNSMTKIIFMLMQLKIIDLNSSIYFLYSKTISVFLSSISCSSYLFFFLFLSHHLVVVIFFLLFPTNNFFLIEHLDKNQSKLFFKKKINYIISFMNELQ